MAGFALTTMLDNKITFTWEEIKEACPKIDEVPGAINGFGLLQAIESYSKLQKSLTLSFIHLSVQEYLAAYYIICLQQKEELMVLRRLFYQRDILEYEELMEPYEFCYEELIEPYELYYRKEITHLNVVQMYIGLTKGQHPAFKELLEDHQVQYYLSRNFFTCFLLHSTLYEANDIRSCDMINKCFADRRIIHRLKPSIEVHVQRHIESLSKYQ